ncbi:MAG: carbonic anhydrase family protein [Bacteroidota bacterium]
MQKILGLSLVLLTACSPQEKPGHESAGHEPAVPLAESGAEKHWSYEGETSPEHWTELEEGAACNGNAQSPINLLTMRVKEGSSGLERQSFHHAEATTIDNIVNNGHSIQYNFTNEENYMEWRGHRFVLTQFHFHAPSEHTIDGVRYPLVMHMVHRSEKKEFAVVALLFKEGAFSNSFEFLESYLPIHPGETKEINQPYNFANDIPHQFDHYHYQGSLTTPPCTEGVNWFVFKEPATLSVEQLNALASLMPHNNYRKEQPLNGRKIILGP